MNSKGQIRSFPILCVFLLYGSLAGIGLTEERLENVFSSSSSPHPLPVVSPASIKTEEQASSQPPVPEVLCGEELNLLAASLAKGLQERDRLRPQDGRLLAQEFLHLLCNQSIVRNGMTLHGRRDILLHFLGGIQLGLLFSEDTALVLVRAKELSDRGSAKGHRASGFDYNDLSASAFGVKMSLYFSAVDALSQKNLLSQIASGRLPLSTFCPFTELPHLPAGISPAPAQDEEYVQNLMKEWTRVLSQVSAGLRPVSSVEACRCSAAKIPVCSIDDRRESIER